MRTFTANILVLSAQIGDTTITGTAIDGDTAINFAVANTDVNQRLFVSEAQLVVTGKFRLGKELATIGIWISKIIAVVSIPAPVAVEVEVIEPAPVPAEIAVVAVEVIEPALLTSAQKRAATLAAKRAKVDAETALVPIPF